jgi:two-component system cell cycle sensor histidine kinase/response regulator CckA
MDDRLRERKNARMPKARGIPERPQVRGILRKTSEGLRRRMTEQTISPLTSHESMKRKSEERRPLDTSLQKSLKVIGRAKREWESTVDSLPQLICLIDDQGAMLRTNRTIERWNLGQVFSVKGRNIHQLFHPHCTDSTCYLETFLNLAKEELNYHRSSECEVKDHVIERHLHFQVLPISPKMYRKSEETPSYAVVVVHDITERKQVEREILALEEQLHQSQKMEAICRLAGGMAHDFNNLLTPIVGYSQLATNALSPQDPVQNDLQEIRKAAESTVALVRQLSIFSKRQPENPLAVNLNQMLLNMDQLIRRMAGDQIKLVTLPSPDLGLVKIDPGQFEQVIVNLVVNARDAMPSGGKLILETSNMTLTQDYVYQHSGMTPGEYVMLAVSDTGIGMTQEVKAHLFEPFFTTKGMSSGTGMGLPLAYGIIRQSNGYVLVYSELGHGTTFKIYLPRTEEQVEPLPQQGEKKSLAGGNETILLVEDEPLVRGLAARVLRKQGYHLLEASNGSEALRIAEKRVGEEIHLILTDVVMPGMIGRELAERLHSLFPKMKVLYMSGYTNNAIVHHGILEEGMNYLQKPFTLEALAGKVREVLDQ